MQISSISLVARTNTTNSDVGRGNGQQIREWCISNNTQMLYALTHCTNGKLQDWGFSESSCSLLWLKSSESSGYSKPR
ncbi:uncharacterized protein RAG0_01808 [Rhynchosporium agropyri]|uniref:Uncharacterized protein n=1 Tax=Rhynchosporium agropyri TaxID=914238 RepID=A0A1E1JZ05_9HELO|nr:uncharacterized protein RAG0_01808 [Rhynchosporium agropyri]